MKKNLFENKNTRFKQALYGADKDVLSFAIGTPENPMGEQLSAQDNATLRKDFEQKLKSWRLLYIPIKGKYNNVEKSYMIINPHIDDMFSLFGYQNYNQESFIFAQKDLVTETMIYQYWEKKEGDTLYKKITEADSISTLNDVDNFFSSLKSFKFRIDFLFETKLEEVFTDFIDNEDYYDRLYEQVYQDGKTFKHRFQQRYYMYETKAQRKAREKSLDISKGKKFASKEMLEGFRNKAYLKRVQAEKSHNK